MKRLVLILMVLASVRIQEMKCEDNDGNGWEYQEYYYDLFEDDDCGD